MNNIIPELMTNAVHLLVDLPVSLASGKSWYEFRKKMPELPELNRQVMLELKILNLKIKKLMFTMKTLCDGKKLT